MRSTELISFEGLAGMFPSFLSSMSSTNGSQKGEIRYSLKSFMKDIVICSTNDHVFNEGVSKIFEFTLSA